MVGGGGCLWGMCVVTFMWIYKNHHIVETGKCIPHTNYHIGHFEHEDRRSSVVDNLGDYAVQGCPLSPAVSIVTTVGM